MEASLFSIQLLYKKSDREGKPSVRMGGHLVCQSGGLSLFHTIARRNQYEKGTVSAKMEASLCSVKLLYRANIEEAHCQNGGLSLVYTVAIYNS